MSTWSVIFLVTLGGTCSGLLPYGPSIRDLVTPEPSRHGTQTEWNTIYLKNYEPALSVVVPLANGLISLSPRAALESFGEFHGGDFFVEAPENCSVIAAVQVLHLEPVLGAPHGCLDYLQFSDMENLTDHSPEICGIVEPRDLDLTPSALIGPRTYVAASGKIRVRFFLFSIIAQAARLKLNMSTGGAIAVELTFTASPHSDMPDQLGVLHSAHTGICQFLNYDNDGNDNDTWLYCPDTNRCIHESLFCDGLIQCSFTPATTDIALDEIKCDNNDTSSNRSSSVRHPQKVWHVTERTETPVVPIRMLATRWVVIFIGVALAVLVILGVVWHYTQVPRRRWPWESMSGGKPPESPEEIEARKRRERLQSAIFVAQQLLAAREHSQAGQQSAGQGPLPQFEQSQSYHV